EVRAGPTADVARLRDGRGRRAGAAAPRRLVRSFLVFVLVLVVFVLELAALFEPRGEERFRTHRALVLLVLALLEEAQELVVARRLGVLDVLAVGLRSLERVIEHAHQAVDLVTLGLRGDRRRGSAAAACGAATAVLLPCRLRLGHRTPPSLLG